MVRVSGNATVRKSASGQQRFINVTVDHEDAIKAAEMYIAAVSKIETDFTPQEK